MRIKDIMSTPPVTVGPETSLEEAITLMNLHRVRHLPVMEHGELIGMLNDDDLPASGAPQPSRRVRELVRFPVTSVGPEEKLPRAANLMRSRHLGCLPVLNGGALVGIVTTSDLLEHMGRHTR